MQDCLIKQDTVDALEVLAKKHCGDIFTEISGYQTKEVIFVEPFDSDEKWQAERYNHDCFIRLYELFTKPEKWPYGNGGDEKAKDAIRKKLTMFKEKIFSNPKPYLALTLDFKKYPFGEARESIAWDD